MAQLQLTKKQKEIMRTALAGNEDGTPMDLDQLIDALSYKPTKQSFQFSLRTLILRGLLEKKGTELRRERIRVIIAPTVIAEEQLYYLKPSKFTPKFNYPEMDLFEVEELDLE